jgi:hypothetical protein
MNVQRSASTTGTAASLPEDPRFIGEIADGAREASLAALLILALAIPVFTAWLSIRTLSDRGPIVCYVPEVDYKPVITNSPESP